MWHSPPTGIAYDVRGRPGVFVLYDFTTPFFVVVGNVIFLVWLFRNRVRYPAFYVRRRWRRCICIVTQPVDNLIEGEEQKQYRRETWEWERTGQGIRRVNDLLMGSLRTTYDLHKITNNKVNRFSLRSCFVYRESSRDKSTCTGFCLHFNRSTARIAMRPKTTESR